MEAIAVMNREQATLTRARGWQLASLGDLRHRSTLILGPPSELLLADSLTGNIPSSDLLLCLVPHYHLYHGSAMA